MNRNLVTIIAIGLAVGILASPAAGLAVPLPDGGTLQEQETPPAVDVNRATAEELEQVPGIGPSTAARIIEWRETQGRFERLEDLLNIRGIGVTTLEKLRPYLTVGAPDGGRGSGL